jgi:hypothetical protein
MSAVAPILKPRVFLRLASFSVFMCLGVSAVSASPIDAMPFAPILPVFLPPVGIFDLTPAINGVQYGSRIPAFAGRPIADRPVVGGGRCRSFVDGEICPTLEPGLGPGLRDWEIEIANDAPNGPAVERFRAGFFAPGLAAVYFVSIPHGDGIFFNFFYAGPTLPLFEVFSTVRAPVDLATSIFDPMGPIPDACFGDISGCSFMLAPPGTPSDFGTPSGVPEPGTFTLLGAALTMAISLRRLRKRRT